MNKLVRHSVVLIVVLASSFVAKSQVFEQCLDSNRVNPFYICPDAAFFSPVCGCDNNTYRNDCIAFNVHGVNNIEYDGVCSNDLFFFDLWPNLVDNSFAIYLMAGKPHRNSAQIQIFNAFGKKQFVRNITYLPNDIPTQIFVDTSGYEPGVYFVMVVSGGKPRIRKFVKMNNR